MDIIRQNVVPGSIVHTDGWRAYEGLENLEGMNYTHRVVNHSVEFVVEDGTHTKRIESQWRALRRRFSQGGRRHDDMASNLTEYLWKREVERRGQDPFAALIVLVGQ